MLKWNDFLCVLAYLSENPKNENGLKSFFSRKENGESFSFVQSIFIFVQRIRFFNIELMILDVRLIVLLSTVCFLYKVISETIAYFCCMISCIKSIVDCIFCKVSNMNCIIGGELCSIMN